MFNGVEALRMMSTTAEWIRGVTRIEGEERVDALRRDGRGFVLALAHTGNWELAGLAASLFGMKIIFLARPQKNPLTNAYLDRIRARIGRMFVPGTKAIGEIPAFLREGCVLGILVDLRAKTGGVRVPFLNGTGLIPTGMAHFAREAGVPVLPVLLARDGWARHRWTVLEPVVPDPSRPAEEEIARVTREVISHLDRAIQAEPGQFYWYNKRWVLLEDSPRA
jgi:KDO2-lipid IV(A) lauroyltransferase